MLRSNPCCAFVSVTLAPPTAAPLLSVTTPCTDVVPVCAHAPQTAKIQIARPTPKLEIRCRFIEDHSMECYFRAPFRRCCTTLVGSAPDGALASRGNGISATSDSFALTPGNLNPPLDSPKLGITSNLGW